MFHYKFYVTFSHLIVNSILRLSLVTDLNSFKNLLLPTLLIISVMSGRWLHVRSGVLGAEETLATWAQAKLVNQISKCYSIINSLLPHFRIKWSSHPSRNPVRCFCIESTWLLPASPLCS